MQHMWSSSKAPTTETIEASVAAASGYVVAAASGSVVAAASGSIVAAATGAVSASRGSFSAAASASSTIKHETGVYHLNAPATCANNHT